MAETLKQHSILLLPKPDALIPRSDRRLESEFTSAELVRFVTDCMADQEALDNWLTTHAQDVSELIARSHTALPDSRQAIYDNYFGVARHGGSASSLKFAVGQVLAELAREFEAGSSLSDNYRGKLFNGLAAVLEVAGES
jgi:hypothetical protein